MKLRRIALSLVALACLIAVTSAHAHGGESDAMTQIARANDLYQKGEYAKAVEIYQQQADSGLQNGHLFYNLGNAYFRMGETGRAIQNYLRAHRLIPRDEDLTANLKYAVRETTDRLDDNLPIASGSPADWPTEFNRLEILNLLTVANLLFWITAGMRLLWPNAFWNLAYKTTLTALILFAILTGIKSATEAGNELGVVLAKTADVRSGLGEEGVTLFQLHEGAVVRVAECTDMGCKIVAAADHTGWVAKQNLGF
jgi:tetratricopeptide (TPR) repeat protein